MTGARRLRRLVLGEAGPAPALVLAGVTVVITFIVAAGPRALAAADTRATRQAIAQAPTLDTGAQVSADLRAAPGNGVLSRQDDQHAHRPVRRQAARARAVPRLPELGRRGHAVHGRSCWRCRRPMAGRA